MSTRNYSNRTLKMLFGRAAGRCSMPECRIDVIVDDSEYDPIVIIGDVAHVAASGDRGPRADQALSPQERDDYENLILLCRNCHARIDGQKQKFPSDVLHRIKNEHEEWVRRSLPERGLSAIGWTTLLLEDSVPVDVTEAISALVPDFPSGDPLRLKIQPATNGWTATRAQLQLAVKEVFNSNDRFASRLAIFPLAAVSSCIALGFEITNRPIVKLFQFHRDAPSWKWDSDNPEATIEPISTTYYPASDEIKDVAFCFHFTAAISENAVDDVIPKNHAVVDFKVSHCSTEWLSSQSQLTDLAKCCRAAFQRAVEMYPSAERWHIFYCGPAPGGIVVGQQLNRTMSHEVRLYEFQRSRAPQYMHSLSLTA